MEPLRAEIANLHVKSPDLKQLQPHQADVTRFKIHQSPVRRDPQVQPSNSKRAARPVTGFYPSPFGLLFYCKLDLQGDEDEFLDPETGDHCPAKQRVFRLIPSKLFRALGGQQVEFRIAIHPGFDRFNLDFSANQLFDLGLVKALGFSYVPKHTWKWCFDKPDFPLLRRLLNEGKISANNRFSLCSRYESTLHVKYFNHLSIDFL